MISSTAPSKLKARVTTTVTASVCRICQRRNRDTTGLRTNASSNAIARGMRTGAPQYIIRTMRNNEPKVANEVKLPLFPDIDAAYMP